MSSGAIVSGGEEAKRWTRALYNHPVSSAIDYFIIHLAESLDVMDKESSGHLKHKLRIKVGRNEEAIRNRVEFGPVDTEWMFRIFKARHHEPSGKPISRITKQLNSLDTGIESEFEVGVGTPDGGWG